MSLNKPPPIHKLFWFPPNTKKKSTHYAPLFWNFGQKTADLAIYVTEQTTTDSQAILIPPDFKKKSTYYALLSWNFDPKMDDLAIYVTEQTITNSQVVLISPWL